MNAVARIGRPHGVTGEVTIETLTDTPDDRLVVGREFLTEPDRGTLHLASVRQGPKSLLLTFDEVVDRDGAEDLRNTRLLLDEPDAGAADEFDIDELVGLTVALDDGTEIGTVADLQHGPAQDLLVVDTAGGQALVPFVRQIVPDVDVAAGRVIVDPPAGLLDGGEVG